MTDKCKLMFGTLKKGKIQWTNESQVAFEKIKQRVIGGHKDIGKASDVAFMLKSVLAFGPMESRSSTSR